MNDSEGVWAVHDYDSTAYLICVHPTELEALRVINSQGYGHVVWLPWGMDLAAAIKADKS